MNVSELCVTPSEATSSNSGTPIDQQRRSISDHKNAAGKPDPGIATTTNATNSANHTNNTFTTDDHSDINSPSRFTLPPLAQPYPALQRLPRLDAISSYEETFEEEITIATPDSTQEEESRSSDTEEIKRIIEKCTTLCRDLGRYKTWRKGSERDQEAIFDFVTHTAHEILDSLVSMQQQQEAATSNEAEYEMIRQARNWKENRKPKYRRRSKRSMIGQQCHSCHTSETPEWRRGPDGARTLCNACGLHYSKLLRKDSVTVASYKFLTNGSPGNSNTGGDAVAGGTSQVDQKALLQSKQSQSHQPDQHHHLHYQHFHNQQQHQQNYQQQNQNYLQQQHQLQYHQHHQQQQQQQKEHHPLQNINLPVSIPVMSLSDDSTSSPSSNQPSYPYRPGNS